MKLLGLNKCMTHEQKNNLGLSVTIDNMETGTVQNKQDKLADYKRKRDQYVIYLGKIINICQIQGD